MSVDLNKIAKEFEMTREQLEKEGLKAFMLDKLHEYESERRARCAKFRVETLEEMDNLIRQGKVEEEDILDDFQNVDYLVSQVKKIKRLLDNL